MVFFKSLGAAMTNKGIVTLWVNPMNRIKKIKNLRIVSFLKVSIRLKNKQNDEYKFFILALFIFQPQYKFNDSEVFDLFDRINSKRNNAVNKDELRGIERCQHDTATVFSFLN